MRRAAVQRLGALLTFLSLIFAAAAAADAGEVVSSTFTTGIVDGQPVDFFDQFDNTTPLVYYYTEVVGLHGQAVVHRWKYRDQIVGEVKMPVRKARQALWSSRRMDPLRTGTWTVEVVNEKGEVIGSDIFTYQEPM